MSAIARYKTQAEWVSQDPVLRVDEPGFEEDTGKVKIGDGSTKWTLLPYEDVAPYTLPTNEKQVVMRGPATAMTAADAATVDAVYGAEEAGVINNIRTRVNEIEAKLRSLGIIT